MAREEKRLTLPKKEVVPLSQPALSGIDLGDEKVDPYQQVIDAWFTIFEHHVGERPVFQAKDGKAVKTLVKAFGGNVEKIVRVIENAFHDSWFVKARVDLSTIAANPNPYLCPKGKQPSRQPPRQRAPQPKFDNDSFGGEG